ncbi:hypothetical protein [Lutibacter sp.]|uniref:hypothetical protein n=1 Tax=Lutibacter sp. TaxID=1925666 RepID=UPI001A30D453|nr:hypothetical protein [Lutibacter sp.]MBI9041683.1 hypothetical protein [Lutibacter sp.]
MDAMKKPTDSYMSDIDYQLSEIETDLSRAKLDNNKNSILVWLFEKLLNRISLIKSLIIAEPKAYFNTIYLEMKKLYKEAFGELDGFNLIIAFKRNPDPSKMGRIKILIDKEILNDEE